LKKILCSNIQKILGMYSAYHSLTIVKHKLKVFYRETEDGLKWGFLFVFLFFEKCLWILFCAYAFFLFIYFADFFCFYFWLFLSLIKKLFQKKHVPFFWKQDGGFLVFNQGLFLFYLRKKKIGKNWFFKEKSKIIENF